jgi:S1-C subfamily serine protease
MFSILVQEWPSDIGGSVAQFTEHMNDDEIRNIYEEIATEICKGESKRLKSGFTKIDGEEAQWLIISQALEKAGIVLHSKCLTHNVILPSGYVSFSGTVLSVDNNAELLDTAFEDYLPLFQQIMLSVIINSKWTKQGDRLQEDLDVTLRTGTGFFITSNGWFITNAHVTSMGQKFVIKVGESTFPAMVRRIDESNDLALLKVEGQFPALAIEDGTTSALGTTVFTVGFPNPELQGFSPKLTRGEISSLAGIKDDPRYFQISVPIQPGNSGGALVDASGNVVGVVTAKISDAAAIEASGAIPQNVNYAIKSVYLLDLIKSIPDVVNGLKEPMKIQDMAVAIQTAEKASAIITVK